MPFLLDAFEIIERFQAIVATPLCFAGGGTELTYTRKVVFAALWAFGFSMNINNVKV